MGDLDDLDDLLSDVNSDDDYKNVREKELKISEEYARKADRTIEDENRTPEEVFKDRIAAIKGKNFSVFKNSIVLALREHEKSAREVKAIVNKGYPDTQVAEILNKYKYTYLRCIENIENKYDSFVAENAEEGLQRKARKDFNLYFHGQQLDSNKIDFLIIKDLFLALRDFNSTVSYEWKALAQSLAALSLAREGKALYNEIYTMVLQALEFCELSYSFLIFLAYTLSLTESDLNVLEHELLKKIMYRENFSYKYSELFNVFEDLKEQKRSTDKFLQNQFGLSSEITGEINDKIAEINKDLPLKKKEDKTVQSTEVVAEPITPSTDEIKKNEEDAADNAFMSTVKAFTIKGTKNWNTIEPYLIKLNPRGLRSEKENLKQSFFINDKPGLTDVMLDAEIKRALIKFMHNPNINLEDEYSLFINKEIVKSNQLIGEKFKVDDNNLKLLLYHFGPHNYYKMIMKDFEINKTAFCYKYLADRRVQRHLPSEIIKMMVLNWYEDNINPCNLDFDSVYIFNELRKNIARDYSLKIESYHDKIDKLRDYVLKQSNKVIPVKMIVKKKAFEWFTIQEVFIYARFADSSLLD